MLALGRVLVCAGLLAWTGPARARDELVIGVAQFPSTLHPYVDAEMIKGYVLGFAQRPITSFDRNWQLACLLCKALPTLANGLAKPERLEDGSTGLSVTLQLRDDLSWGDGTPVTSRDIVFTWKQATDKINAFTDPHAWRNVHSVDIVDAKTVVLHLSKIVSDYNQWGPILPEHIGAQAYAQTPTNPGLYDGPYIVTEYRPGERIVLDRNPYWRSPAPALKRVVIRTIENTAALQANLLSGDVDMTAENIGLTLDQVLALRRRWPDRFSYLFHSSLAYEHINLNLANSMLADKRVRQALLAAIDRDSINSKLFEGLQPVAATWVNPLEPNFSPAIPTEAYDPEHARALLAAAGWDVAPDGIRRNAAGDRLSLGFVTTAGNRQRELVQQILQSQWRAVGVEVTLRSEPARTLFGETLRRRKYDGLAMYAYIGEVDGSLRSSLSSAAIPTAQNGYVGGNTTGFSDPAMDADIAALETELDPARQKRISGDMQRIYADQLPVLPLFFRAEAAVLPTWLHGDQLSGHSGYSSRWAETWQPD